MSSLAEACGYDSMDDEEMIRFALDYFHPFRDLL